ncbi:MAG: ATP-binding cassette domain-containing protein [Stenotrophobium sp.]
MRDDDIVIDLQWPSRRVVAELPARGLCLLTGASGAGKSTLLHALAGLVRVPGTVRVNGQIWQDAANFLPAHVRCAGLVFQEASLLPHLNVAANFRFAAAGAARADVLLPSVTELAGRLGLQDLLAQYPSRLSGGERMRAALACALLSGPRWLLLDEALSALDEAMRRRVIDLLLEQAQNLPLLLVTHYPDELAAHAVARIRL